MGETTPTLGRPVKNDLALELPAHSGQVALVRRRVGEWLDAEGFDEDVTGNVVLAVSEAVSNAVEHAYQGMRVGTVRVFAETMPDGTVSVTIADDGRWRVPPTALSSRGRGLLLMRESVDQVLIDRASTGTTVRLQLTKQPALVPEQPSRTPIGHELVVHEASGGVEVVVRGDVPAHAGPALRRTLTTLARGGSVPLTVDLADFGGETDGLVDALNAVAEAQRAAGNRLTVHAPRDGVARRALQDLCGVLDVRS